MTQDSSAPQPPPIPSEPSPALQQMNGLVGTWHIDIDFPDPPIKTTGQVTFEWMKGNFYMVERAEIEHPVFPDLVAIIGAEEGTDDLKVNYYDSRGVYREYFTRFEDGVWTVWREYPGFWQRYRGTLSEDGRTIVGAWEKSSDGVAWEHDFDLTYRKV